MHRLHINGVVYGLVSVLRVYVWMHKDPEPAVERLRQAGFEDVQARVEEANKYVIEFRVPLPAADSVGRIILWKKSKHVYNLTCFNGAESVILQVPATDFPMVTVIVGNDDIGYVYDLMLKKPTRIELKALSPDTVLKLASVSLSNP